MPLYDAALWRTKADVEAEYPDFPSLDALTHPPADYYTLVREILTAARIPLHPYPVTWRGLTCAAPTASPAAAVATVLPSLRRAGARAPTDVLRAAAGYLRPGDMCLVLGMSGAGTSLLLSLLAGVPPPGRLRVSGEVLYGGQTRLAGCVHPAHVTHYIRQHDRHIPELTVRETLQFAADCRWPDFIPHAAAMRRNDVLLTARALGIARVLDTVVGSDDLRGVSGGERKRVTIGEMALGIVSGSLVMDNWSKGLDAATTLSIAKNVREFTDFTQGSAIVSMQAPGADVFALFDTVCMLHEGRLIYFGPTQSAEPYFTTIGFSRPPHRSIPDFISTIAEPKLRHEYVDVDARAPATSAEFAERFEQSEPYADMQRTIRDLNAAAEDTHVEIHPEIVRLASKKTLQAPRHQLLALFRRQAKFLLSTRRSVFSELAENLIFGLLLGSIFWQLPDTPGGAQSRAGVVFLALLFVGLNALATLGTKFDRKRIFLKQREASFYSAWTYLLSQAVFDLLIELSKSICLMVPLYLMAGLNLGGSGQRLLYAILIATFASLTNISLTYFFVGIADDVNAAQGASGLVVIAFVLFTGFLKSPEILQKWLVWIYWIDPLHYSFEALIINEFEGLTFFCNPEDLLPPVPAVPVDLRICPVSTGEQFIADNYGITEDQIYRLYFFLIVLGFNMLFFILSAIATTLAKPKGHAHVPVHTNADVDTLVHLSKSRSRNQEVSVDVNNVGKPLPPSVNFTFSDMTYTVDGGKKKLLDAVTGYAVSGKVVLLMGESGAGKTTLLDVLAMRKTLTGGAEATGEVRFNGQVLDKKALARVSAYCEQSDLHIGETTVLEAVLFSAKLRLPRSMPMSEKMDRVEDTISRLGLQTYRGKLVKSLGSGELKLLTMAVEVVSDPRVLFLDEPTSGISSSSAMTVARVMQSIADSGTSVICTIHQPSKEVFTMFDRLLLLKRGGKTVYFGGIGENGATLRSYFESHGARSMRETENPADWMLEVIDSKETDWADEWKGSSEKQAVDEETTQLASASSSDGHLAAQKNHKGDNSSRLVEAWEVVHRQFRRYWRLPEYNATRVILNLLIAIIIGLLYLRDIDDTQNGATLALAALFLTIIPTNLSSTNVVEPTASGRVVFYREVASGIYKSAAHHLAVGLVELPFTIIAAITFTVVFYFMVGLRASRFGYFFLASILIQIFSVMFGIMMGTIIKSENFARTLISAIFSLLNVLSGFFIRKPEMPKWWRWSTWVNPFSYYLSGVVVNEMSGRTLVCEPNELGQFQLPETFASCADIPGGDFGDLTLPDGSAVCTFCPIPNGEALIERFGADEVNKWVGLVAIIVAIVIFRIITGFGVAKLRFLSR